MKLIVQVYITTVSTLFAINEDHPENDKDPKIILLTSKLQFCDC